MSEVEAYPGLPKELAFSREEYSAPVEVPSITVVRRVSASKYRIEAIPPRPVC